MRTTPAELVPGTHLSTDSESIEALAGAECIRRAVLRRFTGAISGEGTETYFTESSRPYLRDAPYKPASAYARHNRRKRG